ncbi:MAG: hypothetical protein AAF772_13515 [Acidobacteriota bacterium]
MSDRDRLFPNLRSLAVGPSPAPQTVHDPSEEHTASYAVSAVNVRVIEPGSGPVRCTGCKQPLEDPRLALCIWADPYCLSCALHRCDATYDALLDLVLQHGANARAALDVPIVGPAPWIAPAAALRDHLLDALLERLSSFVPQPMEAWRDGR